MPLTVEVKKVKEQNELEYVDNNSGQGGDKKAEAAPQQ